MVYEAATRRYEGMEYRRCGRSGVKLPAIALGLWHNFGGVDEFENGRKMILRAFDLGITHFDLANNYGPPPGSAEENFGRILKESLGRHRDELMVSSKSGYLMWAGPYGEWGSRKNLIASAEQSLKRMGLEYVDIFYSHRPDPETPLEETMGALEQLVRQGKALYVGISSYQAGYAAEAIGVLKQMGVHCLIHQPSYSLLNRWVEGELLEVLEKEGVGCIAFCPLAQGLLSSRYLKGIPADSRAAKAHGFLKKEQITEELLRIVRALNEMAQERGQSLAQMALAWVLKDRRITSALIGASTVKQIEENVAALDRGEFAEEEIRRIEEIMKKS